MDLQVALFLLQDGITNGAIYALLAVALVLVFAVTRVVFIPQGEFIAYGALTLAAIQAGQVPPTLWLLLVLGVVAAVADLAALWRHVGGDGLFRHPRQLLRILLAGVGLPVVLALAAAMLPLAKMPLILQVLLTLLVIVPLGPLIYRLAFKPVAEETNLFLLIVAVAVHLALVGLGLLFFGAEGSRTPAFTEGGFDLGSLTISWQSIWVLGLTLLTIGGLYLFFERTMTGKALRATASNRVGARLMGIPTELAGEIAFALAALIGGLSGVIISPITTIYYDTGFLIGLKGFVGAIIGALASYPVAAVGALLVGGIESFASFWASAFKEVIVFTLIIPVLLWRSLHTAHGDDEH